MVLLHTPPIPHNLTCILFRVLNPSYLTTVVLSVLLRLEVPYPLVEQQPSAWCFIHPVPHHLLINFHQLKSKHPGRSLPGLAETHHSSFHAELAWSGLQRARTKQNSSQVFHLALNYNSLLCRGTDLERKSRAYHLQANPHSPPPHLKLLSPTLSASPCLYSLATTSSYPYMLVA